MNKLCTNENNLILSFSKHILSYIVLGILFAVCVQPSSKATSPPTDVEALVDLIPDPLIPIAAVLSKNTHATSLRIENLNMNYEEYLSKTDKLSDFEIDCA